MLFQPSGRSSAESYRSSRVSNLQKEEVRLAAPASIPRVLQLSVRRSRGEAIGRMKLIGTPYRLFYTGMPPLLLGGSGLNAVCILPWSLLVKSMVFSPKFLYHTPLGYCQE